MVEIRIYSNIATESEKMWMSLFGFEDMVVSASTIKDIFDRYPGETDFRFNIHCDGGVVSEALACYDIIRTSGKTIHTNIDGSCHSSAIILLLSAPIERRTANPNSRSLIHEVRAVTFGAITAKEAMDIAEDIERERNAILDVYEERTGKDRSFLENIMKEEKMRTANELQEYGFISKINSYTTNQNKTKMTNKDKGGILNKAKDFLDSLTEFFVGEDAPKTEVKNSAGELLFTMDREDESIEEGCTASPCGVFNLDDGRIVTISEVEGVSKITNIKDKEPEQNRDDIDALRRENQELREKVKESSGIINDLLGITSNYVAPQRQNQPREKGSGDKSNGDVKNEVKENLKKIRGDK